MQSRILTTILTATLALPVVALAEQASKAPADQPLTRAQSVEARATVTAIDPATRTVTLKNEKGETFPVQAGSAVKNFDQIKVGDIVKATYTESIAFQVFLRAQPAVPRQARTASPAAPRSGRR